MRATSDKLSTQPCMPSTLHGSKPLLATDLYAASTFCMRAALSSQKPRPSCCSRRRWRCFICSRNSLCCCMVLLSPDALLRLQSVLCNLLCRVFTTTSPVSRVALINLPMLLASLQRWHREHDVKARNVLTYSCKVQMYPQSVGSSVKPVFTRPGFRVANHHAVPNVGC